MTATTRQDAHLPLRLATLEDDDIYGSDVGGGSVDWIYDNGTVWAMCTIDQGALVIHNFGTHDAALKGRRTGIGRRALAALRHHPDAAYGAIYANGVERGSPAESFWQAMKAEGLINGFAFVGDDWLPDAPQTREPAPTVG